MNKRVKIVATLGPAVEIRGGKKFGEDGYWGEKLDREASAKNIAQLIKEGANVFRFNFSHGDHAEQVNVWMSFVWQKTLLVKK